MHARANDVSDVERHNLLTSERRRNALDVLERYDGAVDLTSFATAVAASELNAETPDDDHLQRVKISLHHNHLPTLAAAGVLDYDPDEHVIEQ